MRRQINYTDLEILHLTAKGYSSKEIACILHLTESTAESYRTRLLRRLNARCAAHAVAIGYQRNLINENHPIYQLSENDTVN